LIEEVTMKIVRSKRKSVRMPMACPGVVGVIPMS